MLWPGYSGRGRSGRASCIRVYVTGTVDQQLLLWSEYVVAENWILRVQLQRYLAASDAERTRRGEIGHRPASPAELNHGRG
jgi:hypothetical protein